MEVAVTGATGTIGAPLGEELERRGHRIRRLSRRSPEHPIDLTTGEGLRDALDGCEVLIDASNAGPAEKPAREILIEGNRRLLAAAEDAAIRHHVCISIVGIELVPLPYYRVKVEQEELVEQSNLPYSIVRSTQFHDLIAYLFQGAGRFRVLPGGKARLQPVDPRDVAEAIATVAEDEPRTARVTVAGPEEHTLTDLARTWRHTAGRSAVILPAPLPPKLGRALRSGALTDPNPDYRGEETFGEWAAAAAAD